MDECIGSLKGQTFSDFEVIMVDDGSKDESYAMLEGFAAEDERFHAVKHDGNKSLLAARYTGMSHATGDYILFLDSDDYWEKNTLELLKSKLDAKPVDVIRFGYIMEPAGSKCPPVPSDDPVGDYMTDKFPPAIWKNCYAHKVIEKVLERTESFYCNMGEDACLAGILFSCADSFDTLDDCLYHYVTGEGMSNSRKNFTMEKLQRDLKSVEEAGEHLLSFIKKYNPSYTDLANRTAMRMRKFVLFQHVYFEEDFNKTMEFLKFFYNDKYMELFDWGCDEVIPVKIRRNIDPNASVAKLNFN
ncbi:MAG: glycosyltransferase [Lachnospiraceae bacterium]|nr:glycosyltransferase [Lachnospiraceae bacterium]